MKRSSARVSRTWAHRLTLHDNWAVLDLETTGLGPGAEPVEVAVVDPRGDVVLESLVRPGCVVEPGATQLHGLHAASLASAPSFAELYPDLRRVLSGRMVVAYWAVFDRSILSRACDRAKLPPPACGWDCAYTRYAAWRGFSAPLSTACEIEGLTSAVRHRAAADARLVWELIHRMAE